MEDDSTRVNTCAGDMIPEEDSKLSGDDNGDTISTFESATSGGNRTASVALLEIYSRLDTIIITF